MPKLTRNDLVKQFEEVVKQEIINHNNSLLATNVSLNEVKGYIQKIVSDHARLVAVHENGYKRLEHSYVSLVKAFEKLDDRTNSKLENLEDRIESYYRDSNRKIETLEADAASKELLNAGFDELRIEINSIKSDIHRQKDELHVSIRKIFKDTQEMVDKFSSDIITRPNELWDVKKELEEKVKVAKIEAEGVIRHLRIQDKGLLVVEKKIEQIYKLIAQIQKNQPETVGR